MKDENLEETLDDEEDEGPEELDVMLKRTETEFRWGNDSTSKYSSSPKEVLDEYREYN